MTLDRILLLAVGAVLLLWGLLRVARSGGRKISIGNTSVGIGSTTTQTTSGVRVSGATEKPGPDLVGWGLGVAGLIVGVIGLLR